MTEPSEVAWTPPPTFDEYRLVGLLGGGAMGEVYLAHDSLLERPVAIKFVRAADDPVARARFFDEARAIARLQHPNVVAIYRVAEVSGHPYLVSEYVRGHALDQLQRPLPWRQVLVLALDLTRGLASAHRCGVLHGDVKLANAMVTDDGRAKLLDFGLATMIDATATDAVAPPRERESTAAGRHTGAVDATATSSEVVPLTTMSRGSPQLSVEGTPLYAAPELWRGDPATRRSDLYSLGILLYELLAGHAPHRGIPMAELGHAIQHRDVPRLTDHPEIDPGLAAIVDRLVERDAGARFPSADALLVALEERAAPTKLDEVPDGNPFRGLAAFDSAHGSLFFGRRTEIRELVDRVRNEALVVVGGDSGIGKSSLCRAGVLPWLEEHEGWSRVEVVPGRRPMSALAAAFAAWSGGDEAELERMFRDAPDDGARMIRQTGGRRLLLFVDQLEELLTLSDAGDARAFADAIAALALHAPSVRVLATARSDFLTRLVALPGLGAEMSRGLYLLRPLAGDRIREAIVRPAAAKGIRFESEALVETLVEQAEHAPGGLPLLQFTLAELWDVRDVEANMIRTAALAALGGVAGALTRHADRILAGLDMAGRDAARQVLLRLVTPERTRARRPAADLVRDDADRAALEVLVRGRIVVANDAQDGAYEIAHEALLASWSTLHAWLEQTAADHAVRQRVEQAASEWERAGRPHDMLWRRRMLAEAKSLDLDSLAPQEAAFLSAARRAIVRTRLAIAAGVVILAIGAIVVGVAVRTRARRELASVIAGQMGEARSATETARELAHGRDVARSRAFALFTSHNWPAGEDAWTEAEQLGVKEAREYRAASSHVESALALDATNPTVRGQFADLLFERLARAKRDRADDLADELAGRLGAYDDGRRKAELDADARIELDVPAGTTVWRERGGTRELVGTAPLPALSMPPGELVLEFQAPGRATTRLPLLLDHGETLRLPIVLPPADAVPPNMIYVAPGRFLFGSTGGSALRRGFLNSPPVHEVTTGGYLIARHEVTFAEWLEFLDDLPADERKRRTPGSVTQDSSIALTELAPKRWRFTFGRATATYTAETGQRIHYERRTRRADQDWLKFPVSAISFEDALAYAAWLDRTHRVPHAHVCDEYEWERAARGADGRTWPTGETLAPDDANIDVTYGREPLAFGPDEVGSHPRSRSPVGADDMAGNAWEWTRSVENPGAPVTRGGGWYNEALSARSDNREPGEPTQRFVWLGVRICGEPLIEGKQ